MDMVKRQVVFSRMIPLVIGMVALSGCSLNTELSGPAAVVKVSGDGQTAPINTALPTPLSVIVATQFGEAVKNVTVTWSVVPPGGGSLIPTTSLTDDTGIASTIYTTGPTPETVTIQAKASGIPPLSFTVVVTAT
jgi:hypothetical protein